MQLQQEFVGDGVVSVSPNDVHTWSLLEAVESIQNDTTFKSGQYAAEIGVPDPESDDDWIACIRSTSGLGGKPLTSYQ